MEAPPWSHCRLQQPERRGRGSHKEQFSMRKRSTYHLECLSQRSLGSLLTARYPICVCVCVWGGGGGGGGVSCVNILYTKGSLRTYMYTEGQPTYHTHLLTAGMLIVRCLLPEMQVVVKPLGLLEGKTYTLGVITHCNYQIVTHYYIDQSDPAALQQSIPPH